MIAALLATSATPAMAAPFTLKCFIEKSSGDGKFLFSLNENEGQAAIDTGAAVLTKRAMFTPETVKIDMGSDSIMVSFIEINRTDLSIKRVIQVSTNAPYVSNGKCELYTPPNRAF